MNHLLFLLLPCLELAEIPFQATGFKIGEVTHHSAIIWTRPTRRTTPNPEDAPGFTIEYPDGAVEVRGNQRPGRRRGTPTAVRFAEGKSAADIMYAAPGRAVEMRVEYWKKGEQARRTTRWETVDPEADFTRQFTLEGLEASTEYTLRVHEKTGGYTLGRFRTAPAPDAAERVVFAVSTGQQFYDRDGPHGFDLYPSIQKLSPSFFVHTGDILYYDRLAKTRELAWWHWQRMYSLPSNRNFHRYVPSYFMKDDHETWTNDCWPGMNSNMFEFTFEQGLEIFKQQVPMGDKTWRRFRWGRDLEIWLVEGRDFRSPNTMPDGPKKTIWGKEQMAWFQKTVQASDATFRILISPTPVVGPDRDNKNDNHANRGFTYEGDRLRAFLQSQKNMFVICGDRHWQYHSMHPETRVHEFSCGPASDAHAGGWSQNDYRKDYHQFLRVKGGFLSVTAERREDGPRLGFRFHGTDGMVHYEKTFPAK